MDKKKLLALITKKNERKNALTKQSETCEDVATLRSLNAEMDTLNEEIRSLQELADSIPDEKDETAERTAVVNGEIPGVVVSNAKGQEKRKAIDEEGLEYRKAFQQFVTKGTPIPKELRADPTDEISSTTDIAAAIPSVVVNRIVEKLEATGMILPLVTRTAFAAGMNIPVSSVKPTATWVGEGAGSLKQKHNVSGKVAFTHHKLRCEVAITMEASVMAIAAFEDMLVRQVTEAMVKAIEDAIVNGAYAADGTTLVGPKGILKETPATGQTVDIAAAAGLTYQTLTDAEGKLPMAYEDGAVWFMTKKTFMGFIGMVDDNKQPIARINYGIDGRPERTLLGRKVVLNDYMASYAATVTNDTIVAFLFNPKDYVLNTNYNMGIQRKQDWDTEDMLTKAVMAVDGKVVDKNSLVTVTKKA